MMYKDSIGTFKHAAAESTAAAKLHAAAVSTAAAVFHAAAVSAAVALMAGSLAITAGALTGMAPLDAAYAEGTEKTTEEILADNGIPVVYIDIGDEEFNKVNESDDHSYKCESGTVTVTVPEGYKGDYSEEVLDDSGLKDLKIEYFRGRGNSTWTTVKKPYKLKLKKKADLLGMGKDKTWVLLANRYDESMLRNRIGLYMGARMGLDYTPKGLPVDLVVNGKYHGSYLLAQDVKIGDTRVAIDELKDTDKEEPEVTGGYLLALWPYSKEMTENVFATERGVRFGAEEPQFDPEYDEEEQTWKEQAPKEQRDYIAAYMQKTEDAIYGEGMKDKDGVPYTDYMDVDSAAKYWWVEIFIKNSDALTSPSTYVYKTRDTEEKPGKLYWGPLWDLDLTMSESGELEDVLQDDNGFNYQMMEWLDYIRAHDASYRGKLIEYWKDLDKIVEDIVKDGGVFDRMAAEQRNSIADDFDRWGLEDEYGQYEECKIGEELADAAAAYVKTWLTLRKQWVEEHISDEELARIYSTVTFKNENGEVIGTKEVLTGWDLRPYTAAPEKKGYVFTHWKREDTGDILSDFDSIDKDMTLVPVYVKESSVKNQARKIYFDNYDVWADLSSRTFETWPSVVPERYSQFTIRWSSSDPEVAEVDEFGNGIVHLKKKGKTTITAKVLSGEEFSYELTVYDVMETHTRKAETIVPELSTYRLKVGDRIGIRWTIGPQPCSTEYECTSSNSKVCKIEADPMIKATGAGKATVTAYLNGNDGAFGKTTIIVTKYANTLKVSSKAVKAKASALRKKTVKVARKKALTVKDNKGKVTYKRMKISCKKKLLKAAKKKIRINKKTGKITLKKGLKKGTYKVRIRVRAAGTYKYKAKTRTVTVRIRVK